MANLAMGRTLYDAVRQQRLAGSCAVVVGLMLIVVAHAPVVPVVVGCVVAVLMSILRSLKSRDTAGGKQ
jgi:MFS superfamily sulfate permease-like transporter